MKSRYMRPWPLLLAGSVFCGSALLLTALHPAEAEASQEPAGDAAIIQASTAPAADTLPHRARPRRNSALSMPYFSFARPLRAGN